MPSSPFFISENTVSFIHELNNKTMSIKLKDTIYDLVNKATKDGSGDTITSTYLKLSGGTLTGDLALNAGNEDRFLKFQYNNGDTYGWRIGYLGSGAGDANYLVIQTSQGDTATWTNALRLGNTRGDALFSATVTANGGFIGTLTGNITGNASSATKLATARTLWGQSFDGTANVSGNMTGVGTISMSSTLTLTGITSANARINFSRGSAHDYPYNYITAPTGGIICIEPGGLDCSSTTGYHFSSTAFYPAANNTYSLGTSSSKWSNIYATTFTGSLSGNSTSSDHTTYIRITSTNPTSATTYNPVWAINSSATSDGTSDYTPRANNGFSYITLEGTASALGYGIVGLGNSTALGTAGNKYGMLRLYSDSSGYVNIRPGSASTSNYTLYLPGASGQLVYHTNDTQIGGAAQPVYVTAAGEIGACSISAGSGNSNRCLMVTNGSNGMYYTPTITGNYLNGALISTVSDATAVSHTCTNSNGSVSLYAGVNRGLYDNTTGAWIIYLTKAADHVYVPKWANKGSSIAPVYFNSSGEPTQGSTYAGGTKVTLNGTSKGATTASFYAPTSAGTAGQYLISLGGTPTWYTIDPYDYNISRTANTVLAAPNGSAGNATFRKLVAADLPSHTHNYAGSSSAGGAATSANKLNTNAGDRRNPVYFSGGVPVVCDYLNIKRYYTIDASSLSTSNFYPVTFASSDIMTDCEIHSPNLSAAAAYNQNVIHFQLIEQGWADTPKSFKILHHGVFSGSEITIGAIGSGDEGGMQCVWVRGGMSYKFYCNKTPTLRTANTSNGNEIFTVGTGYSGGTNTKVTIHWKYGETSQIVCTAGHSHSYLPLSGGNMNSNARIAANGGNLYIGNSSNAGWVMVQDICSQSSAGDTYWSLRTNGAAHFTTLYLGGEQITFTT